MSSALALFLCTVFVLFMLRLDHKQASKVSRGSWIPTIWMLSIATKPLGTWFGLGEEGDAEGSALDRVILSGILCLGFFLLAKRKLGWSSVIKDNVWLFLLIIYMLISISWSDIPYISFKRWIRELIAVVMAFVVLTEQDPRQAVQSILRRTVYILIPFSLVLIKYYPQYGVEYGPWVGELMWVGVTVQKNGLGRLCLISVFFLIWTLIRRWQGRELVTGKYQAHAEVLLVAIALWLLVGGGGISTVSATAVAALTAGLVMLLSLLWMQRRRSYWGTKISGVIIAVILIYGIVLPFVVAGGSVDSFLTSALGRNQTLTGRTDIWAKLLPFIEQNPIFGYGFGGFWTSTTQKIVYGVKEAHNGYFAACLELGVIGLLMITMFLWSIIRKAQRAMVHDTDWGILCLCFVLMAVIHNISEASINSFQRHLTAVLLFLSVNISVEVSRKIGHCRPTAGPEGNRFSRRKSIQQTIENKLGKTGMIRVIAQSDFPLRFRTQLWWTALNMTPTFQLQQLAQRAAQPKLSACAEEGSGLRLTCVDEQDNPANRDQFLLSRKGKSQCC